MMMSPVIQEQLAADRVRRAELERKLARVSAAATDVYDRAVENIDAVEDVGDREPQRQPESGREKKDENESDDGPDLNHIDVRA